MVKKDVQVGRSVEARVRCMKGKGCRSGGEGRKLKVGQGKVRYKEGEELNGATRRW